MPAARRRRIDAGGVLVMKVKERSEKTVITTGMISPCCPCVRALNVLQNSMMFTPCWPSAGPTGGAGVAWPAGICNLMKAETFFAIVFSLKFLSLLRCGLLLRSVVSRHLQKIQFNRSGPPEDGDHDFQRVAIEVDLFDDAGEV